MEGDPLAGGEAAATGSPHSGQVARPGAMRSRQIGQRVGDEGSVPSAGRRPPLLLVGPAAAPR
jgi:hypothetical protein